MARTTVWVKNVPIVYPTERLAQEGYDRLRATDVECRLTESGGHKPLDDVPVPLTRDTAAYEAGRDARVRDVPFTSNPYEVGRTGRGRFSPYQSEVKRTSWNIGWRDEDALIAKLEKQNG